MFQSLSKLQERSQVGNPTVEKQKF